MKILFKNQQGTITMNGNGNAFGWKILEIQGLGLPEKMYTYNTYVGVAGQEVASCFVAPRHITIKVDIDTKERGISMHKAARVLNEDGELILYHGSRRRAISCRCTSFVKNEQKTSYFQAVLQFEADNPYFRDCETRRVSVAERVKLLKSPVVFPCVFSTGKRAEDVVVCGDVTAEPVIFIRGDSGNSANSITIINRTTNEKITLNYVPAWDETVEINIPKRTITRVQGSGNAESLMDALADDSYLSRFSLCSGVNHIEIVCESAVSVICEFSDLYLEAMY